MTDFHDDKPNKKKYWYHVLVIECVLCGREQVYRERRYTEKPSERGKRYEYRQDACGIHFC